MSIVCRRVVFVASLVLIPVSWVTAQSDFDLEPPPQADVRFPQFDSSPDPDALPTFQFATAEIKNGKLVIATSELQQKLIAPMANETDPQLDPRGVRIVEKVMQNYVVHVPYTEMADGKPIQKIRQETRVRKVPVTRYRQRTEEEQKEFEAAVAKAKNQKKDTTQVPPAKKEIVTTNYHVMVPVTEMVDGKEVRRFLREQRTRTTSVLRGKTQTTSKIKRLPFVIERVQVFDIDGKALDSDEVEQQFVDRRAVIVINDEQAISPYFKSILNRKALFIVCKPKQD
ncbi:MAG: hypothetical protein AAFN77_16165 [Planctomycetota bacterium]